MISDSENESIPLQTLIDKFLLKYRSTPTTSLRKSPNEIIFKCRPKTLIDFINPNRDGKQILKTENNNHNSNFYAKDPFETAHHCKFDLKRGDRILYKSKYKFELKWIPGVIERKVGNVMYLINVDGVHRTAHVSQLKKSNLKSVCFASTNVLGNRIKKNRKRKRSQSISFEGSLRRSKRLKNVKVSYKY